MPMFSLVNTTLEEFEYVKEKLISKLPENNCDSILKIYQDSYVQLIDEFITYCLEQEEDILESPLSILTIYRTINLYESKLKEIGIDHDKVIEF